MLQKKSLSDTCAISSRIGVCGQAAVFAACVRYADCHTAAAAIVVTDVGGDRIIFHCFPLQQFTGSRRRRTDLFISLRFNICLDAERVPACLPFKGESCKSKTLLFCF